MFTPRLARAFAALSRRRHLTLELSRLSDHQLADIGITRRDLFDPARSTLGDRHAYR